MSLVRYVYFGWSKPGQMDQPVCLTCMLFLSNRNHRVAVVREKPGEQRSYMGYHQVCVLFGLVQLPLPR